MPSDDFADRPTSEIPDSEKERGPGKYVYCIIECSTPRQFGPVGIGGRNDEVYTINYERLSAVVSDTPVMIYDPTRENVLTHESVIETVMKDFTVLPMSFGAIFRTSEDVVEFLKDTSDALLDVLAKMKDKIEFGIKVLWDPDTVLKQIESENEEISRLKQEIISNRQTSTYFARMQLGRLVERAMSDASDACVREVYDHFRDCAIASRHNKPIGEKMILNAAFLVDRLRADEFDARVQELAQKYDGRLRFQFSGPWPPYNFVNVQLKLENPSGVA